MNIIYFKANPCGIEPCKNGGKCYNDGEKFKCVCTENFMGPICIERELIPHLNF